MATVDLDSPHVLGLVGANLWEHSREVTPAPGEPCWCCKAVRDWSGKIVSGGVQPGDRLGCAACTALEPHLEATAHRRGKPPRETRGPGRPRSELSARQRRHVARTVLGRAWLAMKDAEAAGDSERAGRLQTLLYRHRDGAIDDAELDRLAGTTPQANDAA